MLQGVIIDDEISNIENLTILLNKYCPEIHIAGNANNVDQGLVIIRDINPAIVFLDIQMPGKGGFDLLKHIAYPEFEVIFVTAYDQYAIQAIKYSAIDYLLKPVDINELIAAVKKAIVNIERKKQNVRLENLIRLLENESDVRIAIPSTKETLFISPSDILYCKSDNNYTIFFLTNKQKHIASKPIFEYEEILKPHGFLRCHQSYLVNKNHIKSWIKYDGDRLLMNNGFEIPIARNRKEKIKAAIMKQ